MIRTWKFVKFVGITLLIIVLVFSIKELIEVRNIKTYATPTEITIPVSEEKFYYSKLNEEEKELYAAIHNGIYRFEEEIVLIQDLDIQEALTTQNVGDVLDYYMKDNPIVFYVDSHYTIEQSNVMHYQISKLQLKYRYSEAEINIHVDVLEKELDRIISEKITEEMTKYEMELALHDYLLENTDYYYCADVEDIPYEKHTAYSALINKSCVCDGFSKAFALLLDKVKIENVVISGMVNSTTHSWNIINLDGQWYNVDVTSDNQNIDDQTKVKTHIFFNVTDEQLGNMYKKDDVDILPKCISEDYNYYRFNDYIIESTANIKTQLKNDITAQREMEALEVLVESPSDITQTLINTLYSLNFNNYKINDIKTIKYFKYANVYIFPKSN